MKKQKEKFVRVIVQSEDDKSRFAEFKRIAYGNKQDPFEILMTIAESYVKKYNPHQHPLVSRKRVFEIARSLKVSFTDNDFNYYKSTPYLKEGEHYVKQLVKRRYKFVYNEMEMTRFLKWLKKYRRTRMLSLRDANRISREKRKRVEEAIKNTRVVIEKPNPKIVESPKRVEIPEKESNIKITPMRIIYD